MPGPRLLATLCALILAVIACNLPGAGSPGASPSPPSAGEMSLVDALAVAPQDGRPEVLRLMGVPDSFTVQWQELEGRLVRWEEWSYFDAAARFEFIDGELVWTADLEPSGDGALFAHVYNPLDFEATMSIADVREALSDQALEEMPLAEVDIPDGVVLAGDQILLGFEADRLVYVQTFILSPDETAPPAVEATSAATPIVSPTVSALLVDDFGGPSPAAPLFGPEYMSFELESGEGALTSTAPGGVVPAMYAVPAMLDFALEVDVRFPQARPESIAGVVFRSDDAADGLAHYYHLAFRPAASTIGIDIWKDGAFAAVASRAIASGVVNANGVNRLRLEAKGSRFQVYVNGTLVMDVSDSRLGEAGILGLSLVGYEPSETVYFDNLRVEALTQ